MAAIRTAYASDVLGKAGQYGFGSGRTVDDATFAGSGEAVVCQALTQLGVPYE